MKSVYVVLDGSSIRIHDPEGEKGTGRVGSAKKKGRGFEVVSAIVLDDQGVPHGVANQIYWARTGVLRRKDHKMRPLAEKETRFWIQGMLESLDHLEEARRFEQPAVRPHFLLDRGADARHVLEEAVALYRAGRGIVRETDWNKHMEKPWQRSDEKAATTTFVIAPAVPTRKYPHAAQTRRQPTPGNGSGNVIALTPKVRVAGPPRSKRPSNKD